MILLDKPYISDFLIDTIKENHYQVVATKVAKKLVADASLNWISEDEAIATIKNNPSQRIYSNSENVIELRFAKEQYAKNIGLIAKEYLILDTQCIEDCIGMTWEEKAEQGFILRMKMIDYN